MGLFAKQIRCFLLLAGLVLIGREPASATFKSPLPSCGTHFISGWGEGRYRRGWREGFQNITERSFMRLFVGRIGRASSEHNELGSRHNFTVRINLGHRSGGIGGIAETYTGYCCGRDYLPSSCSDTQTCVGRGDPDIAHIGSTGIKGVDYVGREFNIEIKSGLTSAVNEGNHEVESLPFLGHPIESCGYGGDPSSLGQFQRLSTFDNAPSADDDQSNSSERDHRIAIWKYAATYTAKAALFLFGIALATFALICHTTVPVLVRWPISITSLLLAIWVLTVAMS